MGRLVTKDEGRNNMDEKFDDGNLWEGKRVFEIGSKLVYNTWWQPR